jgi:Tfp pilus assembly protein PilF
VLLAHSTKIKARVEINRALYFLADAFLNQSDENTATSLLTVALEGFTAMDIHQCRAECMLRLGDIPKAQHDIVKAVQLWKTARPLFERSLQTKQVKHIYERLNSINGHSQEL